MTDEFSILSAVGRDVGRKRKRNEDFVAFFEPGNPEELNRSGRLYVLADGVGGASQGDKASQYAAEKVIFDYFNDSEPDIGRRLTRAFRRAGNEIYEHMEQKFTGARMATTMVAAVLRGDRLTVANVGDSRAYLIREDKAHQITRDHTIAGELMHNGEITEEEARHLKGKNRITRSLGGEFNVHVDIFPDIQLIPGDRIILCSDGVTRYALQEEIAHFSSTGNPDQVVQRIINHANESGGADNISVAAIEVGSSVLHAAATIRRGTIPAPVDWDEFETQPVMELPRRTTFARKLRNMYTPRQWMIFTSFGIVLIAFVAIIVKNILPTSGLTSDAESTGTVESAETATPFPTSTPITTIDITPMDPPDEENQENPEERPEFSPEQIILNSTVENRDYIDDFDDLQFWTTELGKWTIVSFNMGRLELTDKGIDGFIKWSYTSEFQVNDFYMLIDVEMGECKGKDAFAIVARVDDVTSSGYAVEFSCDGHYRIRKFVNVGASDLLNWKYSESIKDGPGSQNSVGIIAKDDHLHVVANGEVIGSVSNDTYSSGGLSLYVNAITTPGLTAYFDNLSLWTNFEDLSID